MGIALPGLALVEQLYVSAMAQGLKIWVRRLCIRCWSG